MIKRYKEIIIILLFALLSIITFREYFLSHKVPFPSNLLVSYFQPWASYKWKDYSSGPPNKPIGFDNLRIFYPIKKLAIEQIKNLEMPLWNPYNFSGNPLLASYQSAIFHPLSFMFFFLPQIDAWSIIIILLPFLASIFTYYFLKELSLSRKSSFFGAVIFAFSGFMIVWWEEMFMSAYSALFLPLVLYGIEKLYKKITVFSFVLLTLALTFSILSGFFQMTLYIWIFSFVWLIFRYSKERKTEVLIYSVAAYVLALLISAIHLIPSFEAFQLSARGSTDIKNIFQEYFLQLPQLATFIAPDYFGNPGTYNFLGRGFFYEKVVFVGIPALFFALFEIFSFKNNTTKEKFLKIAFILTFSLAFNLPTSWFILYDLKIPFLSVILPSRITLLSTFCLTVLAAYGIERFFKEKNKKKILIVSFLLFASITFMWVYGYFYWKNEPLSVFSKVLLKNMIVPTIIFTSCLVLISLYYFRNKLKNYVIFSFIFLSFLSSFYFASKYLYFSDADFVFPSNNVISQLQKISGINRFWGVGNGYIDKNFATYFNFFSPEGFDAYYIKRYGELLFAAQNKGKLSDQIPRTDASLTGTKDINDIPKDLSRKRLMYLLGVKYIVAENTNVNKSKDLVNIWSDSKFTIYENKTVLPRAFLTNQYKVIENSQGILDNIFNNTLDLSQVVILEEYPNLVSKVKEFKGNAKVISYKHSKVIIESDSNHQGILFLSDNYYPGWKAFVDNKEAKIYRANYSFRGVVVPQGKHTVIFEYKPKSFYIGAFVSLSGIIIILIFSIKIRYNKNLR